MITLKLLALIAPTDENELLQYMLNNPEIECMNLSYWIMMIISLQHSKEIILKGDQDLIH